MDTMADLIINCGTLLTVNGQDDILSNVSVIVKGDRIIEILPISQNQKYKCDNVVSAEEHIVMPGFVNTHTHLGMSYFKGLSDDQPLEKWLNDHIWPAEARCINQEFVYDATLHGMAELIKNGTTYFNDMYFLPLESIRACSEVGLRANFCDTVLDSDLGDYHIAGLNERNIHIYIDKIATRRNSPMDISYGPHSVYTVSEETWKAVCKNARWKNRLIHTHLCETITEVENCKQKYGRSPIRFLHDCGAFESNVIFAHGVHLDDEDFQILKDFDEVSVSINLHSNLKLASGIAPIKKYLDHGINITFGTDSVASNNSLSISDEISTAAKLYKAVYNDPTILPAKQLVRMATINGANGLNRFNNTGSIEVGKYADIICINVENFQNQPIYDPYSFIVYSMNKNDICHTIVNGKILMKDRNLTTINEELLHQNVIKYKKIVKE